jgi:hypothetical protein
VTGREDPEVIKNQAGKVAVLVLPLALAGCVRRTLTIQTEPPAALVYLNDQEVGRTPVSVPFTWYGDYDVMIRKPGYQTLQTHARLHPPWYQVPPLDLISEALVPFTVHDTRQLAYTLEPQHYPTTQEVLERAVSLRERTLYGKE